LEWRKLLLASTSIRNREVRFRTKSGEIRTALLSAEVIEVGGVKCVLSVNDDTTDQKRLEEQLLQAQKMEAVGTLAGGIAHDFNNLLTAIIGYSQLLKSEYPEGNRQRYRIEEIEKAGTRAATLTSQLLAFSRRQVLQPRILNLNSVIHGIKSMLSRLIGEDITFTASLDPDLGNVKADPSQIEQVIMNLVLNSRDAMPRGGKLIIETANIELDETYSRIHPEAGPGPYVLMAVSDSGAGMDKQTQARVFEPFFTTKEQGRGTGLGLSTVYGIVKQSGGSIFLYSEPGQGTVFKMYLPRLDNTVEPIAVSHSHAHETGSETLLVVEDEESVRKLAAEVLRLKGYVVLEAGDAQQALRVSSEYPGKIDLLITDAVMPGLSGTELAERFIANRPDAKVLYVSGYTHESIRGSRLPAEALFVAKPFSPGMLLQKVREVLGVG
jgi:two-component system cell cycle sensor histidine kinase/response regulator CckA